MKNLVYFLFVVSLGFPYSASGVAEKSEPEVVSIAIEEAEAKIDAGIQLLDVRTLEEWNEGRLEGARRITLSDGEFLEKAIAELDSEKPVLVYCRTGRRSDEAAKRLMKAGFTTVFNMKGGIVAWLESGKPVEKAEGE